MTFNVTFIRYGETRTKIVHANDEKGARAFTHMIVGSPIEITNVELVK